MRILLISSAFSGLTQRFYTELDDAGYTVSVTLHLGDIQALRNAVEDFQPSLIICPYLTRRLPADIYQNYLCLIVHPGIKGDRGPSSLDWAIQSNARQWGVSLLAAAEEMDAGDIWSHKTFPMRICTKSNLFYHEVTQAAIACLWEALSFFSAPSFHPEVQDYSRTDYQGQTLPMMCQAERALDWKKHSTAEILRRIHAADGVPGVLDNIAGKSVYLFNAHAEPNLRGKPGTLIAQCEQAICMATCDGAIWLGHLQEKLANGSKGIKLPAIRVLDGALHTPSKGWFDKKLKTFSIDYQQPGRQYPCQEVWYELSGDAAYLYFAFHNGAMSTEQCQLLLNVYRHVAALPVKAIVLMGGDRFYSNGIHLNHIEAASSPADESWLNINAIDDLILQIINTPDKLTVSALRGSAGAGGAILALAADWVYARQGAILNPHYKKMGGLFGSEYWTYLLPKRVGTDIALQLTEQCLPISADRARHLGMVDKVLDQHLDLFTAQVKHLVDAFLAEPSALRQHLADKAKTRCQDEAHKPLAAYRQDELAKMYENFYGSDEYNQARTLFVRKLCGKTQCNQSCMPAVKLERALDAVT